MANDYYWQSKLPTLHVVGGGYPPIRPAAFGNAWGDVLFVAIPFYVLAVLVFVTRVRWLAVVLGVGVLVALVTAEYHWDHTTDSSTASLVYITSISLGVPIAVATCLFDEVVRVLQRVARRQPPG